jgi:autotransporter-associated beta strand protein
MKVALLSLLACALGAVSTTQAASVIYDADTGTSGAQDGAGLGWDTVNTSFWDGFSNVLWPNSTADEAIFGATNGAAGTVTVGTVTANKLTFNTPGSGNYTLSGGSITLGGTTPTITTVSNATISSALLGTGWTKAGAGALTLNGGNFAWSGGLTVGNGVLNLANNAATSSIGVLGIGTTAGSGITATANISSGNLTCSGSTGPTYSGYVGGALAGVRGVLNISGTASVTGTGNYFLIGATDSAGRSGAGVVNQSGGTNNLSALSGLMMLAQQGGYGSYQLSGGFLSVRGTQMRGWTSGSLYSQSGGAATFGAGGFILNVYNNEATAGHTVADISGGTLTHTASGNFLDSGNYSGASASVNGYGILTVRSSGYVQEQSGNFYVTHFGGARGVVNLLSGGTIEANRIQKNGNANARATVNFDGGTLKAYSVNAGTNFLAGLDNALVYPGGLSVDNNGTSITIGQALAFPAGYGVGASGTTIPVPSGGSGYIAPPVVKFAEPSGGGVPATGVSTIDANGTVTGILITSPGSGYSSGENVAVTFNLGDNTCNAAVTVATPPTVTASTLNTSGGLTTTGSGTLTLSGVNTYTGSTVVNGGRLYVTGPLSPASAVSVSANATFGGKSTNGAVTVAANGGLNQNSGDTLTLSNLTFSGAGTLRFFPASGTYVAVNVTNALAVNGVITLNLASTPALGTTNHILQFVPGLASGTGGFVLPVSHNPYSIQTNGNYIDLVVGATASLPIWTGSQSTEWSTNSIAGAKNWRLSSGGATDFLPLDNVVFDDSSSNPNVAMSAATVNPNSLTFSNATSSYNLTGAYGISASSLAKVSAGPATLANSAANTFTSVLVTNGPLTLATFAANSLGAVTVNNGGFLLVDCTNTASSVTIGTGGSLRIGNADANGSLAASIANNGTLTFNRADDFTCTTAINGSGSLTKLGGGMLVLSNNSTTTYTGATMVSNGVLSIVQGNTFASTPVRVSAGKTLNFRMTGAATSQAALSAYATYSIGAAKTNNLDGSAGLLSFNGSGYFIFGGNGDARLNLASGGMMDIQGGDVQFGWSAHTFDSNLGGLNVGPGAGLHNSQPSMQFDALTGAGSIGNAYNAAAVQLIVGVNNTLDNATYGVTNHIATFSGAIKDKESYNGVTTTTINFIKTGTGTQILNGANTYTGTTTVSNGTLLVNGPGALGNTPVTVMNRAKLGGSGSLSGALTVQSGGTLAPGASNEIATLFVSGALTLNAGSTNIMRIDKQAGPVLTSSRLSGMAGMSCGGTLKVIATGDPLAAGDTFTLFLLSSGNFTGTFAFDLPVLPAGLTWDKSQLTANGSISVVTGTATPIFNPLAGGYQSPQSVTISSDAGSRIFYTTDGTAPTTTSPSGLSPVTVALPADTNSFTITAYATNAGAADSLPASAIYSTTPVPTWISGFGGSWSSGFAWSNNVVANGTGVTADFSTLTLSADLVVTLDNSPTVGRMLFGDAGSTYNTVVQAGGGTLTLDAGANQPVVTVLNGTNTISAPLAGSSGFVKNGPGTLSLEVDNAYTGGTVVNAGTLLLSGTTSQYSKVGPGTLTVNTNSLLTVGANDMLGNGSVGITPSLLEVNRGTIDANTRNLSFLNLAMTGGTLTNSGTWYSYGDVTVNASALGATINGGAFVLRNHYNDTVFNVAAGGSGSDLTLNSALVWNGGATSFTGMIKTGNGVMTLAATNNTGLTSMIVSNGTLQVNGTVAAGAAVNVTANGTLAGSGSVNGPVTVSGTVSPGTSVGTLTTGAQTWYDGSKLLYQVASADTNNAAGRDLLTINGTLDLERTNNGVFTIKLVSMLNSNTPGSVPDFDASSNYTWTVGTATSLTNAGNLAYLALDTSSFSNPHGGTFALAFDAVAQAIQITYTGAPSVNTTPTNLVAAVSGGQLTLSWPADHTGWTLQAQTNNLNVGLTGTWHDIAGSTTTNQMSFSVDRTKPTVFYRMKY